MCACICVHVYEEATGQPGCHSSSITHLVSWDKVISTERTNVIRTGWLVSPGDSPDSANPALGLYRHFSMPSLFHSGTVDQSHTYKPNTSPTELWPPGLIYYFYSAKFWKQEKKKKKSLFKPECRSSWYEIWTSVNSRDQKLPRINTMLFWEKSVPKKQCPQMLKQMFHVPKCSMQSPFIKRGLHGNTEHWVAFLQVALPLLQGKTQE